LVCHLYGELSGQLAQMVSQHLAACDLCRRNFQQLSAVEDEPVPAAQEDEVSALMARIKAWDRDKRRQGRNTEPLKRRVSAAIEPYLGKRAADSLLQPVREDGRDLLSNVAPLLSVFLGRRAAGHLVSHVVETTIVRA
jgi:hypothetical protein